MEDLFVKLYKWAKYKSLSLKKVFDSHDEGKKGKMSYESFKGMALKHKNDLTDEEMREMFKYFDKDNSNTVEYNEILGFYCEVNKIEV
jgi:Ca2+-binding EF-hand superfamily protein